MVFLGSKTYQNKIILIILVVAHQTRLHFFKFLDSQILLAIRLHTNIHVSKDC